MRTTQENRAEFGSATSDTQATPICEVMEELQRRLSWWNCLEDEQKKKIKELINDLLKKPWFRDMSLSQKVEVTEVLFQHENLKEALRRTSQPGRLAVTPLVTPEPAVIKAVPKNKR